jgi:hypothetical protein
LNHFINEEQLFLNDIKLHEYFEHTPNNTDTKEINVKLHLAYHDDTYGPYVEDITRHILALDIDTKIKEGKLSVVKELANIKSKNQTWNLIGFASKYCNYHNPDAFPIYTSRAVDVLHTYFKVINIPSVDLDDYLIFSNYLDDFQEFIGAQELNYKELDKFIWLHRSVIREKYDEAVA